MAEPGAEKHITSLLDSAFQQAGAEWAEALGAPVGATVGDAKPLSPEDLQRTHQGECLLVTGSLSGAAEGTVAFLLKRDAAARLAELAERADADGAGGGKGGALSEGDIAAVAFALARVGAAATAVWQQGSAHPVQWPAEATELTPALVDVGEGIEPVAEALGGEAVCWHVHLDEPANVDLLVLVPTRAVEALAQASGGEDRTSTPGVLSTLGSGLMRVLPVELPVRVEVGRRTLTVRELLELMPGRVLDLEKSCDGPLELFVGQKLVACGDAMLVDSRLGFRVGELARSDAGAHRRRKLVR